VLALTSADRFSSKRQSRRQSTRQSRRFQSSSFSSQALARSGRQGGDDGIQGGVDFSNCQNDPNTGLCCIEKEETVQSIQKDPILECTHKNVEKCHYTYVTVFEAAQEEVCEENFEKTCQITFKQQAMNETVQKCYKPIEKVCNGQGPEKCRTVYESACTTKYIEKQPGKFVGDTACEKLPVEICGAGCISEEGPEECHDKTIVSLIDVPEEMCDLNPQKTCRLQTKLVPRLKPKQECTIIPQETCNLKFSAPRQVNKPLLTRWCLDEYESAPGETYKESNDAAPVLAATEPLPAPAFNVPAFDVPAFDVPAFDVPAFNEPVFNEPAFSEPAFSEPAFSEPAFSERAFNEPLPVFNDDPIVFNNGPLDYDTGLDYYDYGTGLVL
jgi:hypothetical protein